MAGRVTQRGIMIRRITITITITMTRTMIIKIITKPKTMTLQMAGRVGGLTAGHNNNKEKLNNVRALTSEEARLSLLSLSFVQIL